MLAYSKVKKINPFTSMKYALKEWNTTIDALGKGQVIAVWRKGGISDKLNIREPFESFNVDQEQFVLLPTFTHQASDKIKKDFWFLGEQTTYPNKDNQVKIKYWAEITETFTIETIDELLSISSELVNTDEHLISSFNLYPDHKGKVLLLRIYILSNPVLITNLPEYAGCKSWIELKVNIPKIGSKPVLSFKDFSQKARQIKALLEQARVYVFHEHSILQALETSKNQ